VGNNGIDLGESEDDSDYADEPRDYPTPQSLDKQANTGQNGQDEDILSESNQAVTPSETPFESSQRRPRAGRATVLSERARENL
jgi:hypothetical protein